MFNANFSSISAISWRTFRKQCLEHFYVLYLDSLELMELDINLCNGAITTFKSFNLHIENPLPLAEVDRSHVSRPMASVKGTSSALTVIPADDRDKR